MAHGSMFSFGNIAPEFYEDSAIMIEKKRQSNLKFYKNLDHNPENGKLSQNLINDNYLDLQ